MSHVSMITSVPAKASNVRIPVQPIINNIIPSDINSFNNKRKTLDDNSISGFTEKESIKMSVPQQQINAIHKKVFEPVIIKKVHTTPVIRIGNKKFYSYLVRSEKYPDRIHLLGSSDYIPGNLIVARDYLYPNCDKPKKIFSCFNYIDFFIWYLNLPIGERVFYEVIPEGSQKPRFDVDIESKKHNIPVEELPQVGSYVRDVLITAIETVLREYNVPFSRERNLLVYNSHVDTKQSFHFVIDKYFHEDSINAKNFYTLVNNTLPENIRHFVDHKVYNKNQQFRLLGHHKINKNNIKIVDPITTWNANVYPQDDPAAQIGIFSASLVSFYHDSVRLPPFIIDGGNTNNNRPRNNVEANEHYDNIVAAFESSDFSNDFRVGQASRNFVSLLRRHPSWCPVHNRIHDNENAFISVANNGMIYWNCRRNEDGDRGVMIGSVNVNRSITDNEGGLLPSFIDVIPETPVPQWSDCCDIEQVSTNILDPYPLTNRIIAIKSPMDTRKTVNSFSYIRDLATQHPDYEIVIVSTRRSFTRDSLARFTTNTGLPFVSYLDPLAQDTKYFITQVESCYKDTTHRKIVIMDEFRSLLSQFDSGLHGNNLYMNRKVFEDYITNAEYLLVLDADLDKHCTDFIHALRPDDRIHLVHNIIQKRQGYHIIKYMCLYEYLEVMATSFSYPENNVVIPTNSYDFGNLIANMFAHRNIRFYSSKEDDHPEELADINNAVQRFNTLIYTSTLGSGVDINVEHFHEMFLYASPKSCCARDLIQMCGRIRNLRNRTIHLFIGKNEGKQAITFDSVLYDINTKLNINNNDTVEILKTIIPSDNIRRLFRNKYTYTIDINLWTTNYIINQIERNKSKNDMHNELDSRLAPQGYTFTDNEIYLDPEDLEEWKVIYKEWKDLLGDRTKNLWKNARIISKPIAKAQQQLINDNNSSKREKLEVSKHKFLLKFTPDTDHNILANIACDKKHPTHIRNCVAETILTPSQILSLDNMKNPLFSYDKFLVSKVTIIKHITNDILGITSSFDSTTEINPNRVIPFCPEIIAEFPTWKRLFGMKGKVPSGTTITKYMKTLSSVIELWNGCTLKKPNTNRRGNYKITPFIPELQTLVDNYVLPRIRELSVDTTSNVVPEISNVTTVTNVIDVNITTMIGPNRDNIISEHIVNTTNTGVKRGTITLPQINDYYTNNNHTITHPTVTLNINPILNTITFPTIQQPYNPFNNGRVQALPVVYKPPTVPLMLHIIPKTQ